MAFRDRFGGCPDCGLALAEIAFVDATGQRCAGCAGTWLDRVALETLVARQSSEPLEIIRSAQVSPRRCAACSAQMNVATISVVTVELCECGGIWFDRGELERVMSLAGEPPWVRTLLKSRAELRKIRES